ncbi:hypothetical protein HMPREF9103_02093 [Lentilactobacillus parafarraginis F0439]|uniref:Uncharacterized protein n=1 Tax=Lentilactobacillus parafarraginis F0439 TaxID=797515 RepID=G9ZQT5_9LACO|nr:hypothetical protein HMPREF9103_02093 [Lentilactobacillus parafarraginis F0439]
MSTLFCNRFHFYFYSRILSGIIVDNKRIYSNKIFCKTVL